jgi:VWFA-related protein
MCGIFSRPALQNHARTTDARSEDSPHRAVASDVDSYRQPDRACGQDVNVRFPSVVSRASASAAALRRPVCTSVITLVAAGVLAAQSGGTKPPPPQEQRPPTFRSEANFIRVDVYPTSDGKPVQDLRVEDFEVLEDNVAQTVQTFEHVVVRPAGPQQMRAEPNSIGASLQLAGNPRNRVFILFLDVPHVTIEGTWNVRQPLIRLIDQILGPDDLVGVMKPEMAASDITLARKTQVVEGGLLNIWPWGERHTLQKTEREYQCEACFPSQYQVDVVQEMTARRRERTTLDSLHELVLYLRNIREERKAILTVSEGWLLFRENQDLTRLRIIDPINKTLEPTPGPDPIGVGPDGRLTNRNTRNNTSGATLNDCWADRQRLAMMDNDKYFRDIIGEANRGNSSFYTIDPRGLPVFDTPINQGVPVHADFAMLKNRQESMRTLAEATDGMAVMNSNDLNTGLKRIADDLTSYYLLGYYSTNGKLDGRLRTIKVRVKRPGVAVRARKGYRAATEAEVTAARTAAAAPVPEIVSTVSSAMGTLDRVRPGVRFYVSAVPSSSSETKSFSTVWVTGELQSSGATDPWMKGGTADVEVSGQGNTITSRVTLAPGDRGFMVPIALTKPVASGALDVRVRMSGTDPAAERAIDSVNMDVLSSVGHPLLFRRGPTTGNRLQPVATFHFSRTERVRLEAPMAADVKPGSGRVLDKAGQPLTIPVTVGERTDARTGERWLTADITLAALAPGDYAIEITAIAPSGEQRVVSAIRVAR